MRPKVLEIAWHETQAIYSCDFQPLPTSQLKRLLPTSDDDDKTDKASASAVGRQYRLATCGGDFKVRLWMVHPNIPTVSSSAHAALTGQEIAPHPPRVEYLATLVKHTAAVNVVRFSPNGQTLASASDDRPIATFGEPTEDLPDKEHWRPQKMLQVTNKHVYDLAWSPDGEFFIAGSTDNTATIWKASTGECVFALREHTHNVQGVSWDPLNEYIATQSSDRAVHVNTFAVRNGVPEVHPVTRASRMEIRHSRTPSFPSASIGRPPFVRRGSTASETGSVITTASEMTEHPALLSAAALSTQPPPTPNSISVPSTPNMSTMNPPPPGSAHKPSSRRSSFSSQHGAASPALSVANPGRGRSPSPIPPLPAMRAPAPTTAIMQRLYAEESATRFFRRLNFSPDGSLLLTPAGQIEDQVFKGSPLMSSRSLSTDGADRCGPGTNGGTSANPSTAAGTTAAATAAPPPTRQRAANVDAGKPTVYIYSRANLARAPIANLPGHKTPSVAIRFSPIFYDLRTGSSSQVQAEPKQITLDASDPTPVHVSLSMPPPPPPQKEGSEKDKDKDKPLGSVFALPYRLLYAVACQDAVLLYDTQQAGPVAIFRGLHYAGFTDIAWSPDGQAMMLSSADGYCSIVVFDLGELGTVHPTQQHHRQLAAIAHSHGGSSATATPMPHSPAVSTMRASPAPPRSEREESVASSAAQAPLARSLFPGTGRPSSSSVSSVDQPLPTPSDETESFIGGGLRRPSGESDSTVGLGLSDDTGKRERPDEGAAPKKKRRVVLTHLGDD